MSSTKDGDTTSSGLPGEAAAPAAPVTTPEKHQCLECAAAGKDAQHVEAARCTQCGGCLYLNAKQLDEEEGDLDYPLFKCKICEKVNFWD